MRGAEVVQECLFTTIQLESFVSADHLIRPLRELFNVALERISYLFDAAYVEGGRESVAPERLLRALLLQVLCGIRSERQLVEQMHYNLLFRWFVGLSSANAHAHAWRLCSTPASRTSQVRRVRCDGGLHTRRCIAIHLLQNRERD